MTPDEVQERLQDLRDLHQEGSLTPQALTIQLYGLYVEAVQAIAQDEVGDPQKLCQTLIQAVVDTFPDRPWASHAKW